MKPSGTVVSWLNLLHISTGFESDISSSTRNDCSSWSSSNASCASLWVDVALDVGLGVVHERDRYFGAWWKMEGPAFSFKYLFSSWPELWIFCLFGVRVKVVFNEIVCMEMQRANPGIFGRYEILSRYSSYPFIEQIFVFQWKWMVGYFWVTRTDILCLFRISTPTTVSCTFVDHDEYSINIPKSAQLGVKHACAQLNRTIYNYSEMANIIQNMTKRA